MNCIAIAEALAEFKRTTAEELAELKSTCAELKKTTASLKSRVYELENQNDPSKLDLRIGDTIIRTSRDEICNGTPRESLLNRAFSGRSEIPYKVIPTYNLELELPSHSTVMEEVIMPYIQNRNIFLESSPARRSLYNQWKVAKQYAEVLGLTGLTADLQSVHKWIIADFIYISYYDEFSCEDEEEIKSETRLRDFHDLPNVTFDKLIKLEDFQFTVYAYLVRAVSYSTMSDWRVLLQRLTGQDEYKDDVLDDDLPRRINKSKVMNYVVNDVIRLYLEFEQK